MEKKINYLARDFQSIKGELINFTKKYYPELSDNFNDASVGTWFIDLLSAVGDDLSYHTDRMYQETNLDSAKLRSSVLNAARLNGVKIPGPKCSMCEVELSVNLPLTGTGNNSLPNWVYAPLIKRGSTVGNSKYQFELLEDVDFASQFNSDGVSNRKFTPMANANGSIQYYKVTKTVMVYGGFTRIYKKVLTESEVVPFMEIVLPEQNICGVESIIFKETASLQTNPQTFEFFIEEEEYKILDQDISTYRYFEVDSLSDQYRFASQTSFVERGVGNGDYVVDISIPQIYEDYTEGESGNTRTMRYFSGKWKPISQKFITEYTDNNYLKIIFGCGTDINEDSLHCSPYGEYVMSKVINNNMLGLMPKAGWVMYVLYRVGGGAETNLGPGAINKVINANVIFPQDNGRNIRPDEKSTIINSLKVFNNTSSIGGKDAPSTEEIKFMTKYCVNNQNRCVTLKDYKAKVMQIPPKFGCPFRCNAMEDNNKIILSVLNVNNEGQLTTILPKMMADNIVEYLSHFKSLTDYVELHSGKIFNLGFEIDVFVDKNYTTVDVINTIINTVTNYFDINKHDMGADIFVGDLEKEINMVDGVISLIDLRVYSLSSGNYSTTPSSLPQKDNMSNLSSCNNNSVTSSFNIEGGNAFEINLDAIDHVLYNDIDSMYEIKFPSKDIQVRVKLR
jgi:hypothetical protein